MAFNGSFSATLSPTSPDTFGSHLSNSISSLTSSTSGRVAPSQISKSYRQASQLFLTRRLPEALSTVLPLITPATESADVNGATEPAPIIRASRSTRIKVWSLYLTILNAILELDADQGKEAFGAQEWRALCQKVRNGDVWEEVVQFGYHGVEGDVDSDVVINLATLLLSHARSQILNQKRLENYLAASNTPNLDISRQLEAARSHRHSSKHRRSESIGAASGAATPRDLNARVKILELYTLHVLLRNNEWDYAREFISVSSVLDDERREAFLQALQSLQDEQYEAERREREEEKRQEEQLRKDIEEARRLRDENEARERRRLEEERAKRNGSEVDYGIDSSPQPSSPSKTRPTKNGSAQAKAAQTPSTPKAKKAVATPGFGARAAMIINNLRHVIEQMGQSLRTNPLLLMRLMAFIVSIVVLFSRRDLRERLQRIMRSTMNKIKQTAGMGVKVDNLGAAIAVFLQTRALEAIEGVGDALAAADDAFVLVVAEAALVANADEGRGADVGVADGTLAVAFIAGWRRHSPNHENANPEKANSKGETVPEPSPTTNEQKRKASSPSLTHDHAAPSSPKRSRTQDQARDPRSQDPRIDRRELARQEERKRGKRLFGGLMTTLSQAGARPGAPARRRPDVERRHQAHQAQQAKTAQQHAEEERLRSKKLARLEAVRKVEQLTFQEQAMKTNHADMLSKAGYLKTQTRPQIYYLPWELTRSQRDRIETQKRDAEDIIEKELYQFAERKKQRLRDLGMGPGAAPPEEKEPAGEPKDENPPDKPPQPVPTNSSPSPSTNKVGLTKDTDRVEDVMIEEDEDTVDALVPNDPRVEHKYSTIGDIKYHYMLAKPQGNPVATIFLIHGWPDLGMGWRNQVPFLMSLGLQVVVPDMLGYGRTSAPDSYEEYAMKKMTAHIAHIIKEVTNDPIILGGHDWGSMVVWRLGQYYPELIRGIFSICVPHLPMNPVKQTLEELVEKLPNFKYQLQLAGGEAEQIIAKDPEKRLRGFLNGMFGGSTPEGGHVFTIDRGVVEENIDSIGPSPMVSKDIIDFYVQEYSRHSPSLHGPCNWYRTRWTNANDEAELAKEPFKFPMPAMLVMAENDAALPPWLAKGQEQYFAAGLRLELLKGSSHWAMAQKPVELNQFIGEFVKSVLGDEVKAAL
ncbi:hypothetical protein F5Y18DRAFT_415311 [Xylariaceae sp. FL1019]|nr:hypothetical protein F5Y18DRAFT_415311 [Xylariaceae sp. FL1019]